jgi:hypothetical protein
MARSLPRWAGASERSNESRLDVPAMYTLRLTEGACTDLGISHPEPDDALPGLHVLVQKFADHYCDAVAIDTGEPFAQMPGRAVFRIKRNDWRGLVWADREAGVMWLCRAVCLSDFPREELAYDALAAIGDDIFPTDEERKAAEEERILLHALWAMRGAMQEAHVLSETWCEARIREADQRLEDAEVVGRAYVEPIAKDEDDELEVRFLIAVTIPPAKIISGEEWVELVMTRVFPRHGGEVLPISPNDLPGRPAFAPGPEIALAQESF